MNRAVALLLLALLPVCAQSQDKPATVQWLYGECTAPQAASQIYCAGYVRGIVDALLINAELLHDNKTLRAEMALCGTVSNAAAVQAFKNWAEKHPEAWSEPMFAGVVVALRDLWGCE